MKNKWTGLFVLLLGVGLICVMLVCKEELGEVGQYIMLASGAICFLSGALILKKTSEKIEEMPDEAREERKYSAKTTVMTAPEIALYSMLRQMTDGRLEILCQVALVSIVDKVNYTSYRNDLFRIMDFVLCDRNFKPLVVIELNDSSHMRKDRIERDQKIAEILSKAGLPLVTLTLQESTDYNLVRRKITSALR